jgi:hypothetical protein
MEVSGQLHAPVTLPPGKEPLVPTVQETGSAAEPVWTLQSREKSLTPTGNRAPAELQVEQN